MTPQANQPSADVPEDVQRLAEEVATDCIPFDPMAWKAVKQQVQRAILADRQAREEACDGGGWRSEAEAPEGWHKTYRLGEARTSVSLLRIWPGGDREWIAPDGRTTVTHSTYAAPTHYLVAPALPAIRALTEAKEDRT